MDRTEVERKRASVVFDGSDDEAWYLESEGGRFVTLAVQSVIKKTDNAICPNGLCSQYNLDSANNTYLKTTGISYGSVGAVQVYDPQFTTLAEWIEHLTSNPMEFEYELAEPIIEELDTDSQIALNSLETFNGVTYIEIDSVVQPSVFEVEYGTSNVGATALEAYNIASTKMDKKTFVAGNNVTITETDDELIISSTGGGASSVGTLEDLGVTASATELNYMTGVTSNVQTQLNNKSEKDHEHTKVNGHTVEKDVPSNAVFTDTTYSVVTTSEDGLMSSTDKAKLDNVTIVYGTCNTSGSIAAKIITVNGGTGWELKEGAIIRVAFMSGNTASSPTLNVNNTGAKAIAINGATVTSSAYAGAVSGSICEYLYNGSEYMFLGASYAIDKDGNEITSNYVKTSNVVNNLTSSSTTLPLSANQGRVLNNKIANLSAPSFETLYGNGSDLSVVRYGNVVMCTFTSVPIPTISASVAPIILNECPPAGIVTCTGMYIANTNTAASTVGYMIINPSSGDTIFYQKAAINSVALVTTGVFTGTLTYITAQY